MIMSLERRAKELNLTLKAMTCKRGRVLWPVGFFFPKDSSSCSIGDGPEMGRVQWHGNRWEGFCHHPGWIKT